MPCLKVPTMFLKQIPPGMLERIVSDLNSSHHGRLAITHVNRLFHCPLTNVVNMSRNERTQLLILTTCLLSEQRDEAEDLLANAIKQIEAN